MKLTVKIYQARLKGQTYLNDDVKLSAVDFHSNGAKDFREVSCRWTGVSAHNGQDVSSHVTHFD